jgi:membrane fusion protein (multidrug efflux system)
VNFSIAETEMLEYNESIRTGRIVPPADKRYTTRVRQADGSIAQVEGRMDFADARVDPKTGTIRARAEFPNPQARILPGQFVRVLVNVGELKDALAVPQRAITQAQATRLVLVVDGSGKVEARPVKLGPTIGDEVVIYAGVKAGERVVVDGLMKARPGTQVKPVPVSTEDAAQPPKGEPPRQPPPPKA